MCLHFAIPEDLTIWVSVSSPWLDKTLQMHLGSCCEPPPSSHGLCGKCLEVSDSISSQGLGSVFWVLLFRSSSHMHRGRSVRRASAFRSKRNIQSRKSCCSGNPRENLGFEVLHWRWLIPCTWSSPRFLMSFLDLSLEVTGLFVITLVLSGPISILYLMVVVSRRSTRTSASSSPSAFTTMSSAKRKFVINRPPMLTHGHPMPRTWFSLRRC